jgi:CRP/FNR family transcriptional regulator, cyclic AMP receptor protein
MTPGSLLSRVAFFQSLSPEELRAMAAACRSRTFARGEVLFNEGDPGTGMYILQSGQVKIMLVDPDGEETILHLQGSGECLGELSLIDGAPRSASAVALDRVAALTLFREDFLALLDAHPAVERAVMCGLAGMVRRLSVHVQDVTALDATRRLAKKLCELADRYGEPEPPGVRVATSLTQRELARMLGLTRVSINRLLAVFETERLLTWDRSGLVIHQPDALRRRSQE